MTDRFDLETIHNDDLDDEALDENRGGTHLLCCPQTVGGGRGA